MLREGPLEPFIRGGRVSPTATEPAKGRDASPGPPGEA